MFIDSNAVSNPLRRRLRDISLTERMEETTEFIKLFYKEVGNDDVSIDERLKVIKQSLKKHGYYEHTYDELCFGAKVAWRNHSKCIGRLIWNSLEVLDCRHIESPDEIAMHMQAHMHSAFNGGRIQSVISIFPPVKATELPSYIESYQIIQYAGYLDENTGKVIGDKQNIAYTRMVTSLGWKPPVPRGMFNVLPFCIREPGGKRLIYHVDSVNIHEVHIKHPEFAAIADLGLRWYAVPCVSNMILTVGGIDYPCAPFNGFYMATEIASRDLCDFNRYDQLAHIAKAIGCDIDQLPFEIWKDRALTEINYAVLDSFTKAGITIIDHHRASRDYIEFMSMERASGRSVSADWSWIVPPQASSSCPVFHLNMVELNTVPNFYHHKMLDGNRLTPYYGDTFLTKFQARLIRWRRRFRNRMRKLVYEGHYFRTWFQ